MLAPELVVHLFAPAGDSRAAERGYDQLRRVWYASRKALGVHAAALGLRVPADLPDSAADLMGPGPLTDHEIVASQQGPADVGVFQTVLRRQHGLLCLSAILAPFPGAEVDWPDLDARWDEARGAPRSELVDEARIYQGLVPSFDVFAHYPHSATAGLALRCAAELPTFDRAAGWESRGASTISGFAVWEPAAGDDYRPLRRLMIIASAAREAALGGWVWSVGGTAAPPVQLYLAQAAKLRLQGRIWSAGATAADQLRRRLDTGARQLGSGLAEAGLLGAGPTASTAPTDSTVAQRLAQLRADVFHEASARTSVLDLERNVRIAAANMRALTAATVIPTGLADPFEQDQQCAQHLLDLLGDGGALLKSAGVRARAAVRVAEQAGLTTSGGAPADDQALAGDDRLTFLDELSEAYADTLDAYRLLEKLGVPRRRLPVAGGLNPRNWWGEVFRELESGLVAAPFRGLLGAALVDYRHNRQFLDLAERYGVPVSRVEGSVSAEVTSSPGGRFEDYAP
ncbi:hypothetical protein I6A62_10970 [Frankia sp. AgW1.1]|nr:hypothetical protein [Frankia sp. AgW1.1]MBL7622679.1 hypothetical protein [Frankia sp. AgB1.8]